MNDEPGSLPPPAVAPAQPIPNSEPSPRPQPRRTRSAGHVIAIVVGCLLALPGLGLLAGGGTVAIAQAVATDDDGYFRFTLDRIESDGVAVAASEEWFDHDEAHDTPWVFDFLDVDVRLRVDGAAATDDVFVGIGRAPDVEAYLAGAGYAEIVDLDDHTPEYDEIEGRLTIAPPTEQDFWTVAASGSGEQQVDWEARGGRWAVVVMNADGSPGVAADVEIGARSGVVTPVAVGLIVAGGVLVVVAGVLIAFGARGRRTPPSAPTASGPNAPGPTDESITPTMVNS